MSPGLLPFERGTVRDHPYVAVGEGSPTLVLVPGLNDPLLRPTSPWWFSILAAMVCRRYAEERQVLMVGRPEGLPEGHTTRAMADGYAEVLEAEGPADVLGLSMGGFVVQHLAADHPDLVDSVVLGLSGPRVDDEEARAEFERWRTWAEEEAWHRVYVDAAGTVSEGVRGAIVHGIARLYSRLGAQSATDRSDFLVSVEATLTHDATDRLADVSVPTLVLGGDDDDLFSEAQYREAASAIEDSTYVNIDGGHEAVVNNREEFDGAILEFLDGPAPG